MKLCRFQIGGRTRDGIVEGGFVVERDVPATHHALGEVRLLAPVQPRKYLAIGLNYADHIAESGLEAPEVPFFFNKQVTCVVGPGEDVHMPRVSKLLDYEGELAIVVGTIAKNVKRADWRDFVRGFACANDVTARDLQKKDVQFTRAKSFDTFCALGPCIEDDLDVSALKLQTRVNGEVKQDGNTSQMVFPCDFLFEFITSIMTLLPGDVILTGTPAGVGPLNVGDEVAVTIEGIGTLTNKVVKRG